MSDLQQPFDVHHDGVDMEDQVEVFRSVIGQNQQMIHNGDYVKLASEHYEVGIAISYVVLVAIATSLHLLILNGS